jgi:outer membrane protein TolC
VSSQKKGIKAQTESELQKLNVDLYALNDRVNQLYFGILLLNEQLAQNSILQDELATNHTRVEAYKTNGVATQSDIDAIKVEQINAQQRELELKSTLKSFRQMLGGMIAQEINETTALEKPIVPELNFDAEIKRPELILLDAQSKYIESQRDAVMAGTRPRVSLFLQGGYGRPGLNMLNNVFSPYYIGGFRFAWNLSSFYTQKSSIDKIENNRQQVDVQKETFLFNNKLANKQFQNDIERLKLSIKNDDNIIQLRNNIKKSCEVKVQNGTATVTDLLREINAENLAQQAKSLHQIQLYIAVYHYKNNTNN